MQLAFSQLSYGSSKVRRRILLALGCLLALSSCDRPQADRGARALGTLPARPEAGHPPASASTRSAPRTVEPVLPDPQVRIQAGGKGCVSGKSGVVTSVEAQATRAGVEILQSGGNAVDAAVAVAYALSVTHPSAASLGGGGFMLIGKGHEVFAADFRENAPLKLPRDRFDAMIDAGARGPVAVGVPGMVRGLTLVHERFGKLPRRRVMAPAIRLAKDGYLLSRRQHLSLQWNWAKLAPDQAFRRRFADPKTGRPWAAGSKLRRPQLARSLELIADSGPEAFYQGELTHELLEALGPDALLTRGDFGSYRARWRDPLRFYYRGLDVATMPPPSAGGVALTQTLLMLQELKAYQYPYGSREALHLLVESAKRAHAERRFSVVDPDALSAAERSARRARWLDPKSLLTEHPIDLSHATPSRKIHPLFSVLREHEHTTHFAVVDADGLAVSCTITLSAGFGAKLLDDRTGIILNNAVASFSQEGENLPIGGRRTTSSMAPTLVYAGNDLVLVLGSPGGDTIPNTVVQVLQNVVDYGMTIDAAVDAPRIHHGFFPDEIRYERQRPIDAKTRKALVSMGHTFSKRRISIGDANSILMAGNTAYAVVDQREGGLALAAQPSPAARLSQEGN